jgi:hypothetical protein
MKMLSTGIAKDMKRSGNYIPAKKVRELSYHPEILRIDFFVQMIPVVCVRESEQNENTRYFGAS